MRARLSLMPFQTARVFFKMPMRLSLAYLRYNVTVETVTEMQMQGRCRS